MRQMKIRFKQGVKLETCRNYNEDLDPPGDFQMEDLSDQEFEVSLVDWSVNESTPTPEITDELVDLVLPEDDGRIIWDVPSDLFVVVE